MNNAKIISGFMDSEHYRSYLNGKVARLETSFKAYIINKYGLRWLQTYEHTERYQNLVSDIRLAESIK